MRGAHVEQFAGRSTDQTRSHRGSAYSCKPSSPDVGRGRRRRMSRPNVDQRKSAILDAAVQVIIEVGFTEMTVADVAKVAGVSTALVHYHFSSKVDLITAALGVACDDDKELRDSVADGPGECRGPARPGARASLPSDPSDASWLLWIETWGETRRLPALREAMDDLTEHEIKVIYRLFAEELPTASSCAPTRLVPRRDCRRCAMGSPSSRPSSVPASLPTFTSTSSGAESATSSACRAPTTTASPRSANSRRARGDRSHAASRIARTVDGVERRRDLELRHSAGTCRRPVGRLPVPDLALGRDHRHRRAVGAVHGPATKHVASVHVGSPHARRQRGLAARLDRLRLRRQDHLGGQRRLPRIDHAAIRRRRRPGCSGEKILVRTYLAIGIAFVGLVIMVAGDLQVGDFADNIVGDLAALVSAAGFAFYAAIVRSAPERDRSPVLPGYGVLMIVICATITIADGNALVPPAPDIGLALVHGAVFIVGGTLIFNIASRSIPAAAMTVFAQTEMVLVPVWAFLLLSERPTASTLVGGTIIVIAVVGMAVLDARQSPPSEVLTAV